MDTDSVSPEKDTSATTSETLSARQQDQQGLGSNTSSTVTKDESLSLQPSKQAPSPMHTEVAGEAAKVISMETNQDSKQVNRVDQKESDLSPQTSNTADNDMKIVAMETTDQLENLPDDSSLTTSGMTDVTMESSAGFPANQTATEDADSMVIETELPRDVARDQSDKVFTADDNASTTENLSDGLLESHAGLSRDNPKDKVPINEKIVSTTGYPREDSKDYQTEVPRDDPGDGDQAPVKDKNVSTTGYPREDAQSSPTRIPRGKENAGSEVLQTDTGSPTTNLQEPQEVVSV